MSGKRYSEEFKIETVKQEIPPQLQHQFACTGSIEVWVPYIRILDARMTLLLRQCAKFQVLHRWFWRMFAVAHLLIATVEPAQANTLPLLAEYTHSAFGALQRVPSNIMQIAQAPEGRLWLTSGTGLYRYDGVQFERVDKVYGKPLPAIDLFALMVARDGAIWVSARYGPVTVFRHNSAYTYGERDGLPRGTVLQIREAPDGSVWTATREGVMRLGRNARRFERLGSELGLPDGAVLNILFARNGTVWLATTQGAFYRRPDDQRFTAAWPREAVDTIQEAPDGALWALMHSGSVRRLVTSEAETRRPPLVDHSAEGIYFDRDGQAWVLKRGVVERRTRLDQPADPVQRLTHAAGLSGEYPSTMFQDKEGNLWIATTTGIDRLRRKRLQTPLISQSLVYPGFGARPDGTMWISTHLNTVYSVALDGTFNKVANERFMASWRAPDGTLWLANHEGLRRVSPGGVITRIPPPPGQTGRDAQAIQQDSAGGLWVSISGGGGLFRLIDGTWTHNGGLSGFPQGLTFIMETDAQGRIWMGQQHNQISIVSADGARLSARLDAGTGLELGTVLALHRDGKYMWAGGERGVMLYHKGRFLALRGMGGESFRGISGVARLANGELWMNGVDGIYRIGAAAMAHWLRNPAGPVEFEIFNALDGLSGGAPQLRPLPSLAQGANGKLWFSTGSAVASIDPAHIWRNTVAPSVVVRSVEANDVLHDVEHSALLRLPQGTDGVRIVFTALSLTLPERVRFRYRLKGVDKRWHEMAERRAISYTNLTPGNYRFDVSAANEDGVWSLLPASLEIDIEPTFVQTRWFDLLVLLGIALLLYIGYRLRIRSLSGRLQERHQAQLAERSRIARTLHDTLLQSIQGVLLSFKAHVHRVPENSDERARLERTLEVAWKLVDEGRDQITGLRSASSPDELLLALMPFGRELAEVGGHSFEAGVLGDLRPLQPHVHDELFAIGREALINASRHANARHVLLELDYGEKAFTLRVRDDGCGLDQEGESEKRQGHWGMPGMRERAGAIGAELQIVSEFGKGTELVVTLAAAYAYPFPVPTSILSRWQRQCAPSKH